MFVIIILLSCVSFVSSYYAFKFGLFSALTGSLNVGYERSLGPGKSLEVTLGFIGVGRNIDGANSKGAYVKAGMKFILTPDFTLKGMKYAHQLNGWYFKPEVNFSFYETDVNVYYGCASGPPANERKKVAAVAFMLNFVKQMILSKYWKTNQ